MTPIELENVVETINNRLITLPVETVALHKVLITKQNIRDISGKTHVLLSDLSTIITGLSNLGHIVNIGKDNSTITIEVREPISAKLGILPYSMLATNTSSDDTTNSVSDNVEKYSTPLDLAYGFLRKTDTAFLSNRFKRATMAVSIEMCDFSCDELDEVCVMLGITNNSIGGMYVLTLEEVEFRYNVID